MRKSATVPLALLYAALIVYASLYPFEGWRAVGIPPWSFFLTPLPRYWTAFDVLTNFAGYAPLGFLLGLALRERRSSLWMLGGAAGIAAVLSFTLEALQTYIPQRVPSNLDWLLNVAGALAGAGLAWVLARLGWLRRWQRIRARWAVEEVRAGWILLALWPVGLLFPSAVPFGLGQVFERLELATVRWLTGTPLLEWLPLRETELEPLLPSAEMATVVFALLAPSLLACLVVRRPLDRWLLAWFFLLVGTGVTALSAALSYGPQHAWAWLTPPVLAGMLAAAGLIVILVLLPRRAAAGVLLLALAWELSLINRAPLDPYLAQTLQTWEQGRFVRFHGLAQWVGWLWPYAVLAYVLTDLARRDPPMTREVG